MAIDAPGIDISNHWLNIRFGGGKSIASQIVRK